MRKWKGFALAGLVLVMVSPLGASTFIQMPVPDLLKSSSAVIEGRVLNVDSFWNDTNQVIVSEATIFVRDTVYGKSVPLIKVKTFGGTVGDYTVQAIGFPTFEVGDRVFLFVKPDEHEPKLLRVTGYQQGQYRIVTDEDGTDQAISALGDGAHLITKDGAGGGIPATLPLSMLRELVQFEAQQLERNLNEISAD